MNKNSSNLHFGFKKGVHSYQAHLEVKPEADKGTYTMHAEISTKDGKKIFAKDREGLSHLQVEPAIVFAFHQAFAQ